jgi:site-specific recombinase XerD
MHILIQNFAEDLDMERGLSKATISNYVGSLEEFVAQCDIKSPADITDRAVDSYRRQSYRAGNTKGTVNRKLITLRTFLKWLHRKGHAPVITADSIQLAKNQTHRVNFLTPDETKALLEAPLVYCTHNSVPSRVPIRDRALLGVMLDGGLRVAELVSLNEGDFMDLSQPELTVRGKGSKLRVTYLSEETRRWVGAWLVDKSCRIADAPAFTSLDKGSTKRINARITTKTVGDLVGKYAKIAGIARDVTPHTLRHTFATDLMRRDVPMHIVQTLLGHSSIVTTQIYTHVVNSELKQAVALARSKK